MWIFPLGSADARVWTPIFFLGSNGAAGVEDKLEAMARDCLGFAAVWIAVPTGGEADEQAVLTAWAEAGKRYALTPKAYVYGSGRGAGLAQRFTMRHPDRVHGCAVYNAKYWAEREVTERIEAGPEGRPGSDEPGVLAAVPWLVGCGVDTATQGAAERFQIALAEAGCRVDYLDWMQGDEDTAESDGVPSNAMRNALRFFAECRAAG
ncbi:MAG: hypothetical protein AAGG38_02595 [Planctomycetota bacterium]